MSATRADFEGDLLNAPRDVACPPWQCTRSRSTGTPWRPVSGGTARIPSHDAVTWPDEQPGAYRGRFHRPELIRLARLDLSLTGDATGVVVGRVTGFDRG